MKSRFTTLDIIAVLAEINDRLIGMRVNQVYDVDNKTYLIRLQKKEEKCVLLFESGIRIHMTEFDWPKNPAPSGFSMKLRKHLKNKRLESATQLGIDRIVDLQFGTGEAAYHVIIELYDRGNIVLTDYEYTILNILRPRTEGEDVRFAVREVYPIDRAKLPENPPTQEKLKELIIKAKDGENLKKILTPHCDYGPAVLEHAMLSCGFVSNCRFGLDFKLENDMPRLEQVFQNIQEIVDVFRSAQSSIKGFIIEKAEKRIKPDGSSEDFFTHQDFQPYLFKQHEKLPYLDFPYFNKAVDEFFSSIEGQKLDVKLVQQEKEAMKKLTNIRKDHEKRLDSLQLLQAVDEKKARLIELNQQLVDRVLLVIRSAIANQIPWKDIEALVKEGASNGDPVAKSIKTLKLEINHVTLLLSDPYYVEQSDEEDESEHLQPTLIDIDLSLSAFANARKYFDAKRTALKKEQKTIDASAKAFKSAEKKTKQTLKEVATIATIKKARKVYWFEKFFWFISSENYLVIAGRDQQQNELVVKRYLKPTDLYVHADLHGASSLVVKNPSGDPVPPKTLQEAALMAVAYSGAWEAKIITAAWWVYAHQVSKTAPTGEYLTTGSFMIRGRKNFLPPVPVVLGFGLLFKLEEDSIARHLGERKVKGTEDESVSLSSTKEDVQEVELSDEDDSSGSEDSDTQELTQDVQSATNISTPNQKTNLLAPQGLSLAKSMLSGGDEIAFPDTVVALGPERPRSISNSSAALPAMLEEDQITIIGSGVPAVKKQQQQRSNKEAKKGDTGKNTVTDKTDNRSGSNAKRGQKSKLKKIKEKYKDQDEEERQQRMQLLQSAGPAKDKSKKKDETKKTCGKAAEKKVSPVKDVTAFDSEVAKIETALDEGPPEPNKEDGGEADGDAKEPEAEDEDADAEPDVDSTDVAILNSLTGQPTPEDELLFAVATVGPYSALANFKFKIKMIPGTNKRGKAAKTALNAFLMDKAASSREKDLIKSLKDQDIARNMPGKVKLVATQLQRSRK